MIRVQMREQDAGQRPFTQQRGAKLFPDLARCRGGHAGIHQRVAAGILEQPQVDMVEGNGQRHPQPQQALRNRQHLAGLRHGEIRIDHPALRAGGTCTA